MKVTKNYSVLRLGLQKQELAICTNYISLEIITFLICAY